MATTMPSPVSALSSSRSIFSVLVELGPLHLSCRSQLHRGTIISGQTFFPRAKKVSKHLWGCNWNPRTNDVILPLLSQVPEEGREHHQWAAWTPIMKLGLKTSATQGIPGRALAPHAAHDARRPRRMLGRLPAVEEARRGHEREAPRTVMRYQSLGCVSTGYLILLLMKWERLLRPLGMVSTYVEVLRSRPAGWLGGSECGELKFRN